MWEWGRTVAEYAAVAAFTRASHDATRPRITDPDHRESETESTDEDYLDMCAGNAGFALAG
ncbi:hypothetical protein [Nocardia bovistercoris]|uniref:hypothetical protein n=1 Tax=Nocardia bovistercoris TaxID=2785916 RepID=UPI001E449689|nr:hypothetical protein [Nocardia bovistercoris]